MTNENNNTVINQPQEIKPVLNERNTNKEFFNEAITSRIPKEKVEEHIGSLDTKWKEGEGEKPILTEEDQKKLDDYKRLEVKELPEDWKKQLLRKEELERKVADYEENKKSLEGWTNTFKEEDEKTPQQVADKIKNLTEKNKKVEEELNTWKKIFGDKHPSKVEEEKNDHSKQSQDAENELKGWREDFPEQNSKKVKQKIQDLEKNLGEWTKNWNDWDLEKVKKEWALLNERPDIGITDKEFWDDYNRREPLNKSQGGQQELTKEKEKGEKYLKENKQLYFIVNEFLEHGRTKRYVLSKAVRTERDALDAIAELLETVEKEWTDYLAWKPYSVEENVEKRIATKRLELGLSWIDKDRQQHDITWNKEKKERAKQVLIWIDKARKGGKREDYQELFKDWSGGDKYNREYDYDGSLLLLDRYLKVKNPITL